MESLEFGVYVEFDRRWSRIVSRLAQLKRTARGSAGKIIADGRCAILPGGRPNYPFLLQYAGFRLWLSRQRTPVDDTPNAFIALNARQMWEIGPRAAVEHALAELVELTGGTVQNCRMSRGDLSADLHLPVRLSDGFLRGHAVGRSRKTRLYLDEDDMQTWYVGAKDAPIQLRIYDKSAEITLSGKDWFLPLWGLLVNAGVWRFEFQLRREFFRSLGINSLDDLLSQQANLWRYLTTDWFSLRLPDDPNASRRTVHPFWEVVQQCAERFGPESGHLHRQRRLPSPSTDPLMNIIAGSVSGIAARKSLGLEETIAFVNAGIRSAFEQRDFLAECQRKALELGLSGEEAAS